MTSSAKSSLTSSSEQSKSDARSSDTSHLDALSPEEQDVRKKFCDNTYELSVNAPPILEIKCSHVYVYDPEPDELKAIEEDEWNSIIHPKIITTGYGEYTLGIGAISTKYFESREKFDEIYSNDWSCNIIKSHGRSGLFFEQISFQKALKDVFSIKIRCHMKYYSSNKDELKKDLGHDYNREDYSLKQLEEEVFYKLCLKIFGDEEDEEEAANSTIIFRDFRILYEGGDEIYATARRGKRYLTLYGSTG